MAAPFCILGCDVEQSYLQSEVQNLTGKYREIMLQADEVKVLQEQKEESFS